MSFLVEVSQKFGHSAAELTFQGVLVPARVCFQACKIPHCQLWVAPCNFQKHNLWGPQSLESKWGMPGEERAKKIRLEGVEVVGNVSH